MSPARLLRTILAGVSVSLALGGCGGDSVSPIGRALERAEARWDAQGVSHYTVETRVLCFCPVTMGRWHEITVASDSVIAVRLVNASDAGPSDEVAPAAWFRSVESVFAMARRWPSERRGNRVEALFDEETGLPFRLSFITGPGIVDGDAVYEFRALKPGLTANRVR